MSTGGNRGGGNGGNSAARAAANAVVVGGAPGGAPPDGAAPDGAPAAAGGISQESLSERLRLLEQAEQELADRRRELDEREEQLKTELLERGRSLRSGDKPLVGKNGGFRFRVGPTEGAKRTYPTLKTIEVTACDESEAKRYYCATVEDPRPNRQGRQVDPVAIDIFVECIDPRRQQALSLAYQVAGARRKREQGQPLSEQELALLTQTELAMPL